MTAGRLKCQVELLSDLDTAFDLFEIHSQRQLLPILKQTERNILCELVTVVFHADSQSDGHTGGRNLHIASQLCQAEILVSLADGLDEVDRDASRVELSNELTERLLLFPVRCAEIRNDVQIPHRGPILDKHIPSSLKSTGQCERLMGALCPFQPRFQLKPELLVDFLLRKDRLIRLREQKQSKLLRAWPVGSFINKLPDDFERFFKRRRLTQLVLHRAAVVNNDDVVRAGSLKEAQLARIENQPRNQRHDREHDQNSNQQQQQLFDQNPATIPFLTLKQKLHRGEANLAVPQAIDQVNENRRRNQCGPADHKRRIQKVLSDPGFHEVPAK